jgi:hypothetical protein
VSGASPLFVAAQKGRSKVVELLVAAGASVDAAVEHVTALEAAVHAGHMRCAQVLIAAHAHIIQGGQIRAREESEALKWLQQAQECLVEVEETPAAGEDESQRLLSFRGGAMKKKDLAGLSKKDMLTKYSDCLKVSRLFVLFSSYSRCRQMQKWPPSFVMQRSVWRKSARRRGARLPIGKWPS